MNRVCSQAGFYSVMLMNNNTVGLTGGQKGMTFTTTRGFSWHQHCQWAILAPWPCIQHAKLCGSPNLRAKTHYFLIYRDNPG